MTETPLPDYDDLLLLVRWLSRPYGHNEPVFAIELPDGRPLEAGLRLQATWRALFGELVQVPGAWRQCEECRTWYVHMPTSNRRLNDFDIEELARHMVSRENG